MAKQYFVRNATGGKVLPISDGTLTTSFDGGYNLDIQDESGAFIIAFYDANGDPVTPSLGTITPEMSPIAGQWQKAGSPDLVINAAQVIAGTAAYTIPTFPGPAIEGRVTFAGITGATTAVAYFWRI